MPRSEDGLFAQLPQHALVIDHSTTSAALAREMAEAAEAGGSAFVDAPVSGGQAGAENGQLSIMLGGAAEPAARAEALVQPYAKAVRHLGPAGSGQLAKMVNQICVAGVLQGLAEGLAFARCHGLDVETVLAAISQGAAQSWQMENRGQTMAEGRFDFGFAVDLMRKDLGIALQAAADVGASLPATALIDQFYADVQRAGGGRWDTSSLISRLPGGTSAD
jgi:3-hydroxyisobutyrate dehydrogenase